MNLSIKLLIKRKFFFQKLILAGGVLAAACLFLLIIRQSHLFTIQHISCQVSGNDCPDYLQAEWQKFLGRSLFFTDFQAEGERIVRNDPSLSHFQFQKKLPNSLTVSFDQVKTQYQLQLDQNKFLIMDASGMVSDESSASANLPTIAVNVHALPLLTVHQAIDPILHQELEQVVQFLQSHDSTYQKVTLISIDELRIDLTIGQTAELRTADVASELQKLEYLVQAFQTNQIKQPTKVIDLRFKYPILKSEL